MDEANFIASEGWLAGTYCTLQLLRSILFVETRDRVTVDVWVWNSFRGAHSIQLVILNLNWRDDSRVSRSLSFPKRYTFTSIIWRSQYKRKIKESESQDRMTIILVKTLQRFCLEMRSTHKFIQHESSILWCGTNSPLGLIIKVP